MPKQHHPGEKSSGLGLGGNLYYYRVLSGPTRVGEDEHGARVSCFNILPAGESLEGNVPIIGCELDLTDQQGLAIRKMMQEIDVFFDDYMYEYRAQYQQKDEEGKLKRILLEVKNGIKVR